MKTQATNEISKQREYKGAVYYGCDHFTEEEMARIHDAPVIPEAEVEAILNKYRPYFWISIRRASDCLFSRRTGKVGWRIFGYSICIRLFGVLLTGKETEFLADMNHK